LIFWMLVVKTWTAFAQLPAKIHETDLLHAPTNVPLHSISHPYGPNKQCLMDEMTISNVHGSQMELIFRI
jgi:hypothetical protein